VYPEVWVCPRETIKRLTSDAAQHHHEDALVRARASGPVPVVRT
jgi:hypothetical protein